MIFVYNLTIPANTPETGAIETELSLVAGTVHRISIGFPAGCCGLAHIQLYRAEHQVFPTNPGESFASNFHNIEWNESYSLFTKPYSMVARQWNRDTLFSHMITVRIAVISQPALVPVAGFDVATAVLYEPGMMPEWY